MPDIAIRSLGVFLVIAGIFLAYFFAYLPLEAARLHDPNVSLSLKLTFLTPLSILFGAFAAIGGKRGRDWIQTEHGGKQSLTLPGWILTAILCGSGILFHQWLQKAIAAFGYAV